MVRDRAARLLAGVVFAGAAWKCAARDQWIGWHRHQREARLNRIANNVRFLLPPWVQVPHLGSWILGALGGRIAGDWQAKYGPPVVLLETFVERGRFAGTCYRAANWERVGQTTGRSRADRHRTLQVPVKELEVRALRAGMNAADAPSRLAQLQARNRALEAGKARLEAEATRLRSAHARLKADTARLQATHREMVKLKEGLEAQLQEALLELAELKRQLFREKSEKLTPEEEAQLAEVAADLEEQAQRDPPASDDVLEDPADSASDQRSAQDPPRRKRRRRHPLPEHLERETVVLEPVLRGHARMHRRGSHRGTGVRAGEGRGSADRPAQVRLSLWVRRGLGTNNPRLFDPPHACRSNTGVSPFLPLIARCLRGMEAAAQLMG